jgi:hypothetical protein
VLRFRKTKLNEEKHYAIKDMKKQSQQANHCFAIDEGSALSVIHCILTSGIVRHDQINDLHVPASDHLSRQLGYFKSEHFLSQIT